MLEVIGQLVESLNDANEVAYCRLVETRGSTPQKAGALMLVYPDGSQAGTLGGGCVEAEVKRRAIAALQDGSSSLERFQLDSDYGWDDGLICGGRMDVLIYPIQADDDKAVEYFQALGKTALQGDGVSEAVALDLEPNRPPAMALFDKQGLVLAILNGSSEHVERMQAELQSLDERPRPYKSAGLAFLPLLPRCRLIIIGGGHVGKAVAELAHELDFDVWIVDDREQFVSEDRFPNAQRRYHGPMEDVLTKLEVDFDTYCLIVTRGHNHDEKALFHMIDRGARYVGMIGSNRKIKLIMGDLLEQGISEDLLSKVYAPVGLDIGSQTVPEIALSICSELVCHRNRQGQVLGRERVLGPINE